MTTKVTKREQYNTLINLIAAARDVALDGFDYVSLEAFINGEIEAMDKRMESSRRRAAKQRDANTEMSETLFGLLTNDYQTIPDLLPQMQDAMNDETISAQKVASRLKQLIDLGRATKTELTISGTDGGRSRKIMGYALAQ